ANASIARLGESFAFLARDDRGTTVAVMMRGYEPVRLSTHAVETDLQTAPVGDAIGMSYQQNGHEFYVLTFPAADKTWVYDLATNLWHKRAIRDTNNVLHRDHPNCMAFFQNMNLVGDYQKGT